MIATKKKKWFSASVLNFCKNNILQCFIALPPFIDDYDVFVSQYVEPYLKASADIGGAVNDQVSHIHCYRI